MKVFRRNSPKEENPSKRIKIRFSSIKYHGNGRSWPKPENICKTMKAKIQTENK